MIRIEPETDACSAIAAPLPEGHTTMERAYLGMEKAGVRPCGMDQFVVG